MEVPDPDRESDLEATTPHVRGDALLAVAEGNANQPDEATLAHIFSCERCGANVREIRAGLAALGIKPKAAKPEAAAPAAIDAPIDALATSDPVEAALWSETPAGAGSSDEAPAIERSRKMIFKVAVLGACLVGGLVYLRGCASTLH
jgi:hypothetical protein